MVLQSDGEKVDYVGLNTIAASLNPAVRVKTARSHVVCAGNPGTVSARDLFKRSKRLGESCSLQ